MTARVLIASFVTAALVVLAALPWGFGAAERFVLPLIPLIAIYRFTVRGDDPLPAGAVVAIGLLQDLLTHGPLGYWALVLLIGHQGARAIAPLTANGPLVRWLGFAVVAVPVAVAAHGVETLYFARTADFSAHVAASLAAIAIYPPLTVLLGPLQSRRTPRDADVAGLEP